MQAAFSNRQPSDDAREPGLAPFVEIVEDDLGVSLTALLRLTGLSAQAAALLRTGDAEALVSTVTAATKAGLEILGHQADVSQSDAARARLESVAERLLSQIEIWDRGLKENRAE